MGELGQKGQGAQLKDGRLYGPAAPMQGLQQAGEAGGQQLWFHGCAPEPRRSAKHKLSHIWVQKEQDQDSRQSAPKAAKPL